MFRRLVRVVAAALVVLAAVVAFRTVRVSSRQPAPAPATPIPAPPIDLAAALAEAIRYKTVSFVPEGVDPEESARAFEALYAFLVDTFPRTMAAAQVQRIAGHSVLVTLAPNQAAAGAAANASTAAKPALLYAHLDVVPAPVAGWRADPFEGARDADVVYGRGALDDKASAIAILAAAESLLASGWTPARTIYLAFGHDEEVGGAGAAAIAAELRAQHVQLESLLDEGGAVVEKKIPGLARPAAAVAIVEKGYLDVQICVTDAPGHSSTPPRTTAIGMLSEAIRRLEHDPPPAALNPLVRDTLTYPAAEMTPLYRTIMANLWLTAPLIKRQMEKDNVTRALLGSSQAVTMVDGGIKPNVLPERACATVNYRLFPGTTVDGIVNRMRGVINDARVTLEPRAAVPAPAPSRLDSAAGQLLGGVIRRHFPDAVVVPVVSPGTTDSRHFAGIADQMFRFIPVQLTADDLASMHGVNERISVASLTRAYEFYVAYLRALGNSAGERQRLPRP